MLWTGRNAMSKTYPFSTMSFYYGDGISQNIGWISHPAISYRNLLKLPVNVCIVWLQASAAIPPTPHPHPHPAPTHSHPCPLFFRTTRQWLKQEQNSPLSFHTIHSIKWFSEAPSKRLINRINTKYHFCNHFAAASLFFHKLSSGFPHNQRERLQKWWNC